MFRSLLLGSLLALIILEVYVRVSPRVMATYNMQMWKYSSELKKLSDDPLIGHEHWPETSVNLYGVDVTTNKSGLRMKQELSTEKELVMLLGDSISFGWGVPSYKTYPERLQQILDVTFPDKYQVLNLASGNYGMKNYMGLIKKYISLKPKWIVIGFHLNDIEQPEYPSAITYWMKKNLASYGYLYHLYVRTFLTQDSEFEKHYRELYSDPKLYQEMLGHLDEILQTASGADARVIFLNIPDFHRLNPYPFLDLHQKLKAHLAPQNVEYKEVLDEVDTLDYKTLWVSPEDPHPNAEGHALILRSLLKSSLNNPLPAR